jgi:hypothetical protein
MSGKDEERSKRLAEALRENLRRRKAQARGDELLPGTGRGTARSAVEGPAPPAPVSPSPPLHHGQVDSAPHCPALSGGQGDLPIAAGPPPRSGED